MKNQLLWNLNQIAKNVYLKIFSNGFGVFNQCLKEVKQLVASSSHSDNALWTLKGTNRYRLTDQTRIIHLNAHGSEEQRKKMGLTPLVTDIYIRMFHPVPSMYSEMRRNWSRIR